MKKTSELYKEVLKEAESREEAKGICYLINTIKATEYERGMLLVHFRKNKPNEEVNKIFTLNKAWLNCGWWWTLGKYGREQRILFLKYMIEKCEFEELSWWKRLTRKIWWVQ